MLPNRLRKPEKLEDDVVSYKTFRTLLTVFEDRWNDIVNLQIKVDRKEVTPEYAYAIIQRQLSTLGQEMDRLSVRTLYNEEEDE